MRRLLLAFLFFYLSSVSSAGRLKNLKGEVLVFEGPVRQKTWVKTQQGYVALNSTEYKTGTFINGYYAAAGEQPLRLTNVSIYLPDFSVGTAIPQITSITYLLNICDKLNPVNITNLRNVWFNKPISLKSTFQTCSVNTTTFTESNNIIVGPINIPCGIYDFSQCSGASLYGIVDYADRYAKETLGIDISIYRRRIMMLPYMETCMWAGLGNVGCGSTCIAWMNGSPTIRLSTVFHELGHTFGLLHSGFGSEEYGDRTSAMGISASDNACYNSANNVKLGWGTPALSLTTVPIQYNVNVPALLTSKANLVRVSNLYISFSGSDNYQSPTYHNKVFLHISNSTELPESRGTILFDILSPGQNVVYGMNRISFVSYTGNSSRIRIEPAILSPPPPPPLNLCGDGICRSGETKSSCPRDCCVPRATCGNNVCEVWAGENCITCPRDCNKQGSTCCGNPQTGCKNGICKTGGKRCTVSCT